MVTQNSKKLGIKNADSLSDKLDGKTMVKLDNTKIRKLLTSHDFGHDAKKHGRQLEDLACYIFENIPGFTLEARNLYDKYSGLETDLIFWNDQTRSGLYFLPPIIPIECKNWSTPVAGIDLSWFAGKLRNKALRFGIVFARSGITGNESEGRDGYGAIQQILHDGCQMIVITGEDLENITDTDQIVELLKQKFCNLGIGPR
ncbi:MAG TPA: hypothetical protein VEU72_00560 [Nitrosopumilaceae archaeon]|nr:hypothetical protein [Nitrosopumilaceae archaeon]